MLRSRLLLFAVFALSACQPATPPPTTPPPPTARPATYTIQGEAVPYPGTHELLRNESVVSALVAAGFNHDTRPWPSRVWLTRPGRADQPGSSADIDIHHMLHSGDFQQNYLLEPGDILEVGRSKASSE